jgi:hypothetical protein
MSPSTRGGPRTVRSSRAGDAVAGTPARAGWPWNAGCILAATRIRSGAGTSVPACARAIDLGAAGKDFISRLRGVATNGLGLSCVARCGCASRPGDVEAIGFDPIADSRRGSCRGLSLREPRLGQVRSSLDDGNLDSALACQFGAITGRSRRRMGVRGLDTGLFKGLDCRCTS